jgi:hypothetical protein
LNAELDEQVGERGVGGNGVRLTVDEDLHAGREAKRDDEVNQ